jgi:hypothetical protein
MEPTRQVHAVFARTIGAGPAPMPRGVGWDLDRLRVAKPLRATRRIAADNRRRPSVVDLERS